MKWLYSNKILLLPLPLVLPLGGFCGWVQPASRLDWSFINPLWPGAYGVFPLRATTAKPWLLHRDLPASNTGLKRRSRDIISFNRAYSLYSGALKCIHWNVPKIKVKSNLLCKLYGVGRDPNPSRRDKTRDWVQENETRRDFDMICYDYRNAQTNSKVRDGH